MHVHTHVAHQQGSKRSLRVVGGLESLFRIAQFRQRNKTRFGGRRIRSSGYSRLRGETGHPGLDADKPRTLDNSQGQASDLLEPHGSVWE